MDLWHVAHFVLACILSGTLGFVLKQNYCLRKCVKVMQERERNRG